MTYDRSTFLICRAFSNRSLETNCMSHLPKAQIPLRRLPRNFPIRGSRRNGIWALSDQLPVRHRRRMCRTTALNVFEVFRNIFLCQWWIEPLTRQMSGSKMSEMASFVSVGQSWTCRDDHYGCVTSEFIHNCSISELSQPAFHLKAENCSGFKLSNACVSNSVCTITEVELNEKKFTVVAANWKDREICHACN